MHDAEGRRGNARGSATPVVAAVAVALLIATLTFVEAARWSVLSERAAGVADAAAVAAAAAAAGFGNREPCAAARVLAARHGAVVAQCVIAGFEARVRVHLRRGVFAASASARAGQPAPSAIYRSGRDDGASGSTVYGVPVGAPTDDLAENDFALACDRRPVRNIDQGVTCQARRSS